jgi:hypothetical protein
MVPPAPNRKWIVDFTYIWTAEVDLFSRRVVGIDERRDDGPACDRCLGDGYLAEGKTPRVVASLRPRQSVHQQAVPAADDRPRRPLLNEPFGQLRGQCGDGGLLLIAEDRARGTRQSDI